MKRRAVVILLLLVALAGGTIVNVCIAACFWFWGERPIEGTFEAIDYWSSEPTSQDDREAWRRWSEADWPPPYPEISKQRFTGMHFRRMVRAINDFTLPDEYTIAEWRELAKKRTFVEVSIIECGWPLPCVRTDQSMTTSGHPPVFDRRTGGSHLGRVWIPTTVLLRNTMINTVFYAAILWGLFTVPFALRKRRRIKRGLCPKCAYPAGTNQVCTECGAAVVKQQAETA